MNVREQPFHPGHQLPAVEQLADRDRGGECRAVALAPRPRAKVGVDVGGGGDAAGEEARARLHQHRFGRGEHPESCSHLRRCARIGHVAGGVLQADNARAETVKQPPDQLDAPRQPGLGGEVIEIDRDRCCRRCLHHRADIGDEPIVRIEGDRLPTLDLAAGDRGIAHGLGDDQRLDRSGGLGHLGGVGLHGVVEHEKAKPGQQARWKGRQPVRRETQYQGRQAQQDHTEHGQEEKERDPATAVGRGRSCAGLQANAPLYSVPAGGEGMKN